MNKKFVLLLILVIFLSGCGFRSDKKKTNDASWKNEVLWAQECGLDGLPCCQNTEQPCQFGQSCCTSQTDPASNYCADTCSYGQKDAFCRKDEPQCDSGFVCREDKCRLCGAEEQPCCSTDSKCAGELVCFDSRCLKCGLGGNPCCTSGQDCAAKDARDRSRTECMNGVCTYCGSSNGIGCLSQPYCNSGHLLNNNFCLPCGGYNQPCCNEASGMGYDCDPKQGLNCILGFCSEAK